ncbi:alpha/beta-type small acid-soluble spore protein [Terrisporobacter sp.]|uniref:alpha/beta-type small acid-soluble spore protein n=1 Tax=Terrisporobacter sp. TaxID=1965305 RepID=UPI00261571E7|nr:alpha/beta-type small acid-soluble spore protein [Terrisporobacter sp.]
MYNKSIDSNAKTALNRMKMEIARELAIGSNLMNNNNSVDSIGLSARVGGQMSKKLVEMGERELLKRYNKTDQ